MENIIKLICFDFDDTLAVHKACNIRKEDKYRTAFLNYPDCYKDAISPKAFKIFINKCNEQGVNMYLLSWMYDSLNLQLKESFCVERYGDMFKGKSICSATIEQKIVVMQKLSEALNIKPSEILLIDDLCLTREKAFEAGFRTMSPMEILAVNGNIDIQTYFI